MENLIYLEALNKNNVYKEYLLSLYDDVDDSVDDCIPFSFKEIINIIKNLNYQAKKYKRSQLLPILISSDLEKENLYNSIKEVFQNQGVFYIPLCPIDVRIYYHIYSCLIEDFGLDILKNINLNSLKFGQGLEKTDVIRALLKFKQDFDDMDVLDRWFLGDMLNKEELTSLGISKPISDDKNSLELISYICNSFEEPIMLFFEDIELIYQKYGEEYEERWGRGAQYKFLNVFNLFLEKIRNVVNILPCLKTSWNVLLKFSNHNLRSVLDLNKIEFFDLEGLKRKIIKVMDFYWLQSKIRPPINPFFPLSVDLIERFFKRSNGDLKRFFTLCIKTMEDVQQRKQAPAQI